MFDTEPGGSAAPAVGSVSASSGSDVAGVAGPWDVSRPAPEEYGRHPRFTVVARGAIVALAIGCAWPLGALVHDRLQRSPSRLDVHDDPSSAIGVGMVGVGWAVWVFTVGSMLGSFLNVVVHRLPAGRSVVFGRSACPSCGTRIRPRDNIPIVGWLLLGGRCSQCGALIDPRYPLVEASLAGFCLALGFAEVASGGVTLPLRAPHDPAGVMWTVLHPKWDLIGIYAYHVACVALVFTWAIIAAGARRVPVGHVAAVLLIMGLLPVAFPWLHPVPLVVPPTTVAGAAFPPEHPAWLWQGFFVSAAGMLVGGVVGGVCAAACGHRRPPHGLTTRSAAAASLALVGAVLGWQAVPIIASVACVSAAVARRWSSGIGRREAIAPEFFIVLACVAHLMLWRWIVAAWSAAILALRG
jgi:prepilin signal peptidase PulO-like enzyme (type II secretory pathway)